MMKSTDFFLDKAKQYISDSNSIINNYIQFDNVSFSEDDPYVIQENKISKLKLKIKLLFSEFDKGDFFVDEIRKKENSISHAFAKDGNLCLYKSTLELFIDHLNQFRN